MNDNSLISKSERSNFITVIIFLGIVLLTWFVYLTYTNFQPKVIYEVRTKIFGIFALILLIIYCLYYYLNIKRVYVFNNYIEIKTLFKTKKYLFSDFKTYYSKKFKSKNNSWTEYYLITNLDEKITFIDSEYSNFFSFFYDIERKIKNDKKLNIELSKPRFFGIAMVCFFISALFFFISINSYNFQPIFEKDIVYISDVLQDKIKLKKGSKGSKSMELVLKNYPNFTFKEFGYNDYLMNEFSKGDSIVLGIKNEDFKKKISQTLPLNFKDKYLNYSTINIVQFKTKEGNYNLEIENNRMKCRLPIFSTLQK